MPVKGTSHIRLLADFLVRSSWTGLGNLAETSAIRRVET
jgi:hypothetical protein